MQKDARENELFFGPKDFSFKDASHAIGPGPKNEIARTLDGQEYIPVETAAKIANTKLCSSVMICDLCRQAIAKDDEKFGTVSPKK